MASAEWLYQIATSPKRSLDERWEAVHRMITQRNQVPADVTAILDRTSIRRRRGG